MAQLGSMKNQVMTIERLTPTKAHGWGWKIASLHNGAPFIREYFDISKREAAAYFKMELKEERLTSNPKGAFVLRSHCGAYFIGSDWDGVEIGAKRLARRFDSKETAIKSTPSHGRWIVETVTK
jgi:hypothetical protein